MVEKHRKHCVSHATEGKQFVHEFLPNWIVECQTVKCMCCGEKFTDYIDWEKEKIYIWDWVVKRQ